MPQIGNTYYPDVPVGYKQPDISAPGFPVQTKDQKNQAGAPAGYTWDPVEQKYVHSPTQQGQAVNDYTTAANPALASLMASAGSMFGGGAPSGGGAAGVFTGSGSTGTPGGAPGGGGGGSMTPGGYVAPIQMPDFTKANDAAFASAKDKVGKTGRASLDSLRGELGASGMLGGGAEGQLTKDVIQGAEGELGETARGQAVSGANMAADFAKTGYSGSIAQRGQDVSAQEAQARLAQERELSNARLAFEQRQAASQQQLQLLTLALSGLKGAGSTGLVY